MTELAHRQKGKVYRLPHAICRVAFGTVRRDSLGLGREPRHGEGNG